MVISTAKRFFAGAATAGMLALGGGCVVVDVGKPVSFSRDTVSASVSESSKDELLAVEPETGQPRDSYSRLTVRLHRKILTTTCVESNVCVSRITLTSQKRMAVGLFPGAAMLLFPTKGPEGAEMLGPYEKPNQPAWRGTSGWGYVGPIVLPVYQFVSTPYTLLVAPFTPWTVRARYDERNGAFFSRFSNAELAACGMAAGDISDTWDEYFQVGIAGTVKYPDAFLKREEVERKTVKGEKATEVRSWPMSGPFEVELQIPEVGFRDKQTTARTYGNYYDNRVEFVLPSDPRAEDMVADGGVGGPDGAPARRKYRALLYFHPLDPLDDEKEAWSWSAGRVFETDVHLEKGPAYLGGADRRVREVHHYHETRVVEERRPEARPWTVETVAPFRDGRAEYLVTILDGSKSPFDVEREVKPELEGNLRKSFAASMPGLDERLVRAYAVAEYGKLAIRFKGVAFSAQPLADGWAYDAGSRRGRVRLRLSDGMAADEAKRWARENIEAIVKEKNVALEAGEAPPKGAKYLSLDEKMEGGVLTVEFEAVE